MKKLGLFSASFIASVVQVQASALAYGKDDFIVYFSMMGFLAALLSAFYLYDFMKRIFKDPDYRDRIKTSFMDIISLKVFIPKERDNEDLMPYFGHLNADSFLKSN